MKIAKKYDWLNKDKIIDFNSQQLREFIIEHGIEFKVSQKLPKNIKKGQKQRCFNNAFIGMDQNLFYCEGLAKFETVFCLHAWLCNSKFEVIDPTWEKGVQYFGIIFNEDYVYQSFFKNGSQVSLIDDWTNEWPLLREPENHWKATHLYTLLNNKK